jgi:hypothetical protein
MPREFANYRTRTGEVRTAADAARVLNRIVERLDIRIALLEEQRELIEHLGQTVLDYGLERVNTLLAPVLAQIEAVSDFEAAFAALQAAINARAPLASPELTGTPTTPTAEPGTNSTQIASTEFVATAIAALIGGAPALLDTLNELSEALGDDENFAAAVTAALADKAALAHNHVIGDVTGLQAALDAKLPLDGGTLTGPLTLAADPTLALQAVTKQYADGLIALADAMVFKGVIDCSGNPNYPAANAGWTYRVSAAGKIGGAAGPNVEVGDLLICQTDGTASGNHATVGSAWGITQSNIDGAVTGPTSATAMALARYDGTTGKLIKNSGVTLDDWNNVAGIADIQFTTATTTQQLSTTPALPATGKARLFVDGFGREFVILPSGRIVHQGSPVQGCHYSVRARNNSTTIDLVGIDLTHDGASVQAVGVSSANYYANKRRVFSRSTAAAAANAGWRISGALIRRNTPTVLKIRFGIEKYQSGMALFVGVRDFNALGNNDPSNLANVFGVGVDAGQTRLRLIHNDGTGSATTIDLGEGFEINADATYAYELLLWWNNLISAGLWQCTRLQDASGPFASGVITTDLPNATSLALQANTRNGSSAIDLALSEIEIEQND